MELIELLPFKAGAFDSENNPNFTIDELNIDSYQKYFCKIDKTSALAIQFSHSD